MSHPPPNDALAELSDVLGTDNVRTLVRTFLHDFPVSINDLATSDRTTQQRCAHSMKSNARLMGAIPLSRRMAELEERLSTDSGGDVTPQDIAAVTAEFETVAPPLRKFVTE